MEAKKYFEQIGGRLNVGRLATRRVLIVGIGRVGSAVAEELARSAVGNLVLVDHDVLTAKNVSGHVLGDPYLNQNKAEAMANYLRLSVPTARPEPILRRVTNRLSDAELDRLIGSAGLVVAATDDRRVQRRLNRRCLANGVPALFPGLYEETEGGEVYALLGHELPCFQCWDEFRDERFMLRGITATRADALAVVQLTTHLAFGLLDQSSQYARLFAPGEDDPQPPTLFFAANPGVTTLGALPGRGGFRRSVVARRANCPGCRDYIRPESETPAERRPGLTRTAAPRAPQRSIPVASGISFAGVFWLLIAVLGFYGCSELVKWSDRQTKERRETARSAQARGAREDKRRRQELPAKLARANALLFRAMDEEVSAWQRAIAVGYYRGCNSRSDLSGLRKELLRFKRGIRIQTRVWRRRAVRGDLSDPFHGYDGVAPSRSEAKHWLHSSRGQRSEFQRHPNSKSLFTCPMWGIGGSAI
jgi:molybdopterin/thiamine biosynthesis adenylyltransferase